MPLPDRFVRQREERDRLAERLAGDYAKDLPRSVSDRVFSLAWEHGHASGEQDVESYYVDFADLAGDAFRAGAA